MCHYQNDCRRRHRNRIQRRHCHQRRAMAIRRFHVTVTCHDTPVCCTPAGACGDTRLSRKCQHRGYQDPNDCARCRCPQGFGGVYCDTLATPVNGTASRDYLFSNIRQFLGCSIAVVRASDSESRERGLNSALPYRILSEFVQSILL